MSQFWWDHRSDADYILGLQSTPPQGFRDCCWKDDPNTKRPSCSCSNLGCELSWNNTAVSNRIVRLIGELASMYAHQGCFACLGHGSVIWYPWV
eukprot:m.342064 g.342064  ORF g.342064 m.342064 type:complete len:94 (+) comp20621_c0_seq8:1140-1421(+)